MIEVVNIARCPIHGLHGERQECFVCGGPVEQVSMVETRIMERLLANPECCCPYPNPSLDDIARACPVHGRAWESAERLRTVDQAAAETIWAWEKGGPPMASVIERLSAIRAGASREECDRAECVASGHVTKRRSYETTYRELVPDWIENADHCDRCGETDVTFVWRLPLVLEESASWW